MLSPTRRTLAIAAVAVTAYAGVLVAWSWPLATRTGSDVLLSPPDVIEFCFGGDSKDAHLGAARAAGAHVEVLDGPLSLDIDTPDDLLIAQAETPEAVGG